MKKTLIKLAKKADSLLSNTQVALFGEQNALVSFMFHVLFEDQKEMSLNRVATQQGITVPIFRQFIEYFLDNDYHFVSPDDLVKEKPLNKKQILLTFDDGYVNNLRAVPLLREYGVPAVFFVSTNNVIEEKSFWFDVVYRHRIQKNPNIAEIKKEIETLKSKSHPEIEQYLFENFGKNALKPVSDTDRPFSAAEIKHFSEEEYVIIGNHTSHHCILTTYSLEGMIQQISGAQSALKELTGKTPSIIAYPNGNYSKDVIVASEKCGLEWGITVKEGKNYFPLDVNRREQFTLKRNVVYGDKPLIKQCSYYRSDFQLYNRIKNRIQ